MAQRYIYLSDELNQKLKQEENASALICRLLNKYYKFDNMTTIEDTNKAIKQIEEEEQIRCNSINNEIDKLVEIKNNLEIQKENEVKIQNIKQSKEQEFKESVLNNFKVYTDKDMTEEQYLRFKESWKNDEIKSLYDWIDEELKNG
jgi:hypothetical protein